MVQIALHSHQTSAGLFFVHTRIGTHEENSNHRLKGFAIPNHTHTAKFVWLWSTREIISTASSQHRPHSKEDFPFGVRNLQFTVSIAPTCMNCGVESISKEDCNQGPGESTYTHPLLVFMDAYSMFLY